MGVQLAEPEMLIEIEAVAVISEKVTAMSELLLECVVAVFLIDVQDAACVSFLLSELERARSWYRLKPLHERYPAF